MPVGFQAADEADFVRLNKNNIFNRILSYECKKWFYRKQKWNVGKWTSNSWKILKIHFNKDRRVQHKLCNFEGEKIVFKAC